MIKSLFTLLFLIPVSFSIGQCDDFGFELSRVDVYCFGGANGSVDIDAFGGAEPYTYEVLNEADEIVNIEDIATDLEVGTYEITVIDLEGCIETGEVEINSPNELMLSAGWDGDFSMDMGVVFMECNGGTPDYSYFWEHIESGEMVPNSTWGGRGLGCYKATVVDDNGCEITATACFDEDGFTNLNELNLLELPIINYANSTELLTVQTKESVKFYIFDLNGRLVTSSQLVEGQNDLRLNLTRGVYVYRIVDVEGNTARGKFAN